MEFPITGGVFVRDRKTGALSPVDPETTPAPKPDLSPAAITEPGETPVEALTTPKTRTKKEA